MPCLCCGVGCGIVWGVAFLVVGQGYPASSTRVPIQAQHQVGYGIVILDMLSVRRLHPATALGGKHTTPHHTTETHHTPHHTTYPHIPYPYPGAKRVRTLVLPRVETQSGVERCVLLWRQTRRLPRPAVYISWPAVCTSHICLHRIVLAQLCSVGAAATRLYPFFGCIPRLFLLQAPPTAPAPAPLLLLLLALLCWYGRRATLFVLDAR